MVVGGGNAEYAAVDSRHVMSVPDKGLTLIQAGGIPEVWLTAYQLLHFVGKYLEHLSNPLIHISADGRMDGRNHQSVWG